MFADATGDHQWIHVDVDRAKDGPFGATIAHGYLTLSLVPYLGSQMLRFETPGAKLNYGTNKVRFPNPVLVGKRIRAHVALADVADLPKGKQATLRYTIEIEGGAKPACVAETVYCCCPEVVSIQPVRHRGRCRSGRRLRRPVGRDVVATVERGECPLEAVLVVGEQREERLSLGDRCRPAGRATRRRHRPAPGPPCRPAGAQAPGRQADGHRVEAGEHA